MKHYNIVFQTYGLYGLEHNKVEMEMSRRRDEQGKMGGVNLWANTIAFLMIYNVIMGWREHKGAEAINQKIFKLISVQTAL